MSSLAHSPRFAFAPSVSLALPLPHSLASPRSLHLASRSLYSARSLAHARIRFQHLARFHLSAFARRRSLTRRGPHSLPGVRSLPTDRIRSWRCRSLSARRIRLLLLARFPPHAFASGLVLASRFTHSLDLYRSLRPFRVHLGSLARFRGIRIRFPRLARSTPFAFAPTYSLTPALQAQRPGAPSPFRRTAHTRAFRPRAW